ncbi:MAG: universal stress protein [Thermoanaerobaculum sp.]|nr:universal stress protein [Thermoanaerobaculum sp.]
MFRHILVPLDFNDIAPHTVSMGADLAQACGARLTLLSVVDDSFPNPDILSLQLPWADYYRHLREAARSTLEELRDTLPKELAVEIAVIRGRPAPAIAQFAKENSCDLIIMATHGTSGLQQAILGSVTRRVMYLASCPVMIVKFAPHSHV